MGTGISVGVVLLTLIPTELLDGSASKPLYEYLVPLLRSIVRCPSLTAALWAPVACMCMYVAVHVPSPFVFHRHLGEVVHSFIHS